MSQLTINTTQLQSLVNRANQCVGANKLHRITNMIGIKTVDNKLTLYTTDGTNYLCVTAGVADADDIDVAVNAETFIKLINKITSDTVALDVSDNALVISGNGSYKIALELDDDGEILSFPVKIPDNHVKFGEISLPAVSTILSALKSSLSTNAGSVYANYFVGDCVCATDKSMMGLYQYEMLTNEDSKLLLNSTFVELLNLATDNISLEYDEETSTLIATSENYCLYAKVVTDCADYNISGIKKMLAVEQESYCKVRKRDLLELLDRLSLFVGAYDDGAISLEFTSDSLKVSSMSSTGVEVVNYTEFKDAKAKSIKININRFMAQLKSYTSDAVEIYYGSDLCIKLTDGDVSQVIALMR